MSPPADISGDLVADLRVAIDRRQFEPALQPIVHVHDRTIAGFEALARWRRGPDDVVPAGVFVDEAERSGLLPAIQGQVLGRALEVLCEWHAVGPDRSHAYVTLNFSASELVAEGMIESLLRSMAVVGLGPESVVIELTEGAFVSSPELAADRLSHLNRLGFRIALDDFGTGFSSLTHLRSFPVHLVKIDRSFVSDLTPELGPFSVAAATVQLAMVLGLDVVAEGVETEVNAGVLEDIGVGLAQGYLYSRPLLRDQVLQLPLGF